MKSIIAELWEGSVSSRMRTLALSSPPTLTHGISKPNYVPPTPPRPTASFCSTYGETGVQREAHTLEGEWGRFSSGLGAQLLEKNSNLPKWGLQGPQLVEAAQLERESPGSSFWGGSPICCTRAPSASWHRGLAGEACGPEVGERAQDPEQSKPAGLGSRPERDSTFQTRQNDSPLEQ